MAKEDTVADTFSGENKVVFVNRFYWPDHSATSQILTDLAEHLVSTGISVTIVTSRLGYDENTGELLARQTHHGVFIERVWTSGFGRRSVIGRLIDYLTFYPSAFLAVLRLARKGDIVVAKTDPPLVSVPVSLAARMRRAKLINWLQDLFPEVGAALGIRAAKGMSGKALRTLRNTTLSLAGSNVVICREMAEKLVNEGIQSSRIAVIENWADRGIHPVEKSNNPLRAEWNLKDTEFVLAYSGNLGHAHRPEAVLELVQATLALKKFTWLFIGGGTGHSILKQDTLITRSDNVHFKPYQPRRRLSESLSVGDAHLIVLDPACDGLIMPSKYYGVRAAKRPIVYLGSAQATIAKSLRTTDLFLGIDKPQEWEPALRGFIDTSNHMQDDENLPIATALPLEQWANLIQHRFKS